MDILAFAFIGLLLGWMAGHIYEADKRERTGDLVMGTIGAMTGGFCFNALRLGIAPTLSFAIGLVTSLVGAMLFLFCMNVLIRA